MPLAHVLGDDGRTRHILFAHVPKAGGSSLEDHMEARFGPLELLDRDWESKRRGKTRRLRREPSPQHLDREALARRLGSADVDWSFALVRDPLSRLISAYRFQFHRAWLRRPRMRLAGHLGFSAWTAMALGAARRRPTLLDNHLRPQTDLLPDGAEIFRLEDGLDALSARLDAVTRTRAPPGCEIGHALKSGGPTPVPSRRDLELVLETYAADYDRLGYERPEPDAAPSHPLDLLRHAAGRSMAPVMTALWDAGRL